MKKLLKKRPLKQPAKQSVIALSLLLLLAVGVFLIASDPKARWNGIDETVVERYAAQAGRPAREPYINTDRGDLLLFLFLLAGAAGGFIGGYCYRGLFPPRRKNKAEPEADERG